MELILPTTLQREVEGAVKEFNYHDERQFIEDAIRRRMISLKKISFLSTVKQIRDAMEMQELSEDEILKDFDAFRHSA